jgi:hypothetical protein
MSGPLTDEATWKKKRYNSKLRTCWSRMSCSRYREVELIGCDMETRMQRFSMISLMLKGKIILLKN